MLKILKQERGSEKWESRERRGRQSSEKHLWRLWRRGEGRRELLRPQSRRKKTKGKRDFAAEYERRKEREKNNGSAEVKARRPNRRRAAEVPAPAAAARESGFSFCCMRCGFRHELTPEGLRALQQGGAR